MVRLAASLLFLAAFAVGRKRVDSDEDDGNDVRRAIPGEPGRDYPTYAAVPVTGFHCRSEGFFADAETGCQAFHMCALQRGVMGRQSFLCPNGTIFNTRVNTCDWWNRVRCVGDAGVNRETDYSRVSAGTTAPHPETSDRAKVTAGRRKQPGNSAKQFSSTPSNNFNNVETRRNPVVKNKGHLQVVNSEREEVLVGYNRQPLSNSISTEGYHQTTVGSRKILGTKGYSVDSSRVTEVTIKPRVRYTYNLRASSDNPVYSLNPLIHLARDASLLSTFTDSSLKVTHPVERYVVNDVLPVYKNSQELPTTKDPLETPSVQPDLGDDPVIFPKKIPVDDKNPLYSHENSNPLLGDEVKNLGGSFESSGAPQGSVSGDLDKVDPALSSVTPNGLSDNEEGGNKNVPQTGPNYLPPNRNSTSYDYYPNVVRVTSGYRFTPTETHGHNPQTVKVTNSFSVGENVPTEGPEVSSTTYLPPNLFGIEQNKTTNPSIIKDEDPLRIRGMSNGGFVISQQNLPSDNRKPLDNNEGLENNYYAPDSPNGTDVQFINSFIVNEQKTTNPSISRDGHSSSNQDLSNNGLPLHQQNLLGNNRKVSDVSEGLETNYNDPDSFNDTNVQFINRFIVNVPSAPSLNTNSYNLNDFGTNIYTTPTYSQPVSSNYLPSSSSSGGNLISEWFKESGVTQTQPPTNVMSPTSISANDENVLNTTPKSSTVSYNDIPDHYITKSPEEFSRASFNSQYSQTNNVNIGNTNFIRPFQQESKSFPFSPTVDLSRENQDHLRNIYSTMQTPDEKYGVPMLQSNSLGVFGFVSRGYGSVSTQSPPPYLQNYQQNSLPQIPQDSRYSSSQFQAPLSGNDNVLSTEKSLEIVNEKEKGNIFSGLQIANVLPSVEAHSWTTVITPATTEGRLSSPITSAHNQPPPSIPFSALSGNYNDQNSFSEDLLTTLAPPSESSSRANFAPSLPESKKALSSFSLQKFSSTYNSQKNYAFPTTAKTTATFLSNNEEINLYTAPFGSGIPLSVEHQSTLNNAVRPSYDFSTERSTNQQKTSVNIDFAAAKSTSDRDEGSNIHSSSTEGISSLKFSTPKPFSESHSLYVAPQQHSTILPEYRERGKQLLNPADLLKINSLHNAAELKNVGSIESAELVKSISFSFDSAEDIKQFEIAKSKGLFSR